MQSKKRKKKARLTGMVREQNHCERSRKGSQISKTTCVLSNITGGENTRLVGGYQARKSIQK